MNASPSVFTSYPLCKRIADLKIALWIRNPAAMT
eukprot:CAMPEP_0184660260 /NCGR_PEP_ID=MMETSP0308-20130426/33142_1 /TAXON_ID=38269 /ORGANISM="Gloeochaete witrockiana, Strain SAG 46.84" /LENGTH=33 /DNA_ID= /DNA_START= /DNA_END= /DNA_ORIENTATION=